MSGPVPREKYRYKNESFDKMLTHLLSEMTEEQKSRLPQELVHKIYRSTNPNVNGLTDAQKDYILTIGFGKRIIKIIGDDNSGISIEQFFAMKDVWRKKKGSDINASVLSEELAFHGEFLLADKDLYDALSYLSLVGHSPVFKLIMNARKSAKKFTHTNKDFHIWVDSILNMLVHYESNKRRLVTDMGLKTLSEWYCLIYFYSGEKKSSGVYKDKYKYSFSCSTLSMREALARLKKDGFLASRGGPKTNMVWVTPKGKELVDKMMTKYILNY